MRRRDQTNAVLHLTGTPGRANALARISGHLVLERFNGLERWAGTHFAGATVQLVPGTTLFALDVQKLYRLAPDGHWDDWSGPVSTPELAPPRPLAVGNPASAARRERLPAQMRPLGLADLIDGAKLARAIFGR